MFKEEQKSRLLAVDPSLSCSGWALFDVQSEKLMAVGKIKAKEAKYLMAHRIADLQSKITAVIDEIKLSYNDVLICEAQTTMRDPRAAFQVEQVRGIFETVARSRKVTVPGRINPRSVQFEVLGLKGQQCKRETVKAAAAQVVATVYGQALKKLGLNSEPEALNKHQDIVDAILVGALCLTRMQSAERAGFELAQLFEERKQSQNRGFRSQWSIASK